MVVTNLRGQGVALHHVLCDRRATAIDLNNEESSHGDEVTSNAVPHLLVKVELGGDRWIDSAA